MRSLLGYRRFPSLETQLTDSESRTAGAVREVPPEPYATGWEHLSDELRRLDYRLQRQCFRQRARQWTNPLEQYKGLVVSEEEVFGLLINQQTSSARQHDAPEACLAAVETCTRALSETTLEIERRIQQHPDVSAGLALPRLARAFGLTSFEVDCLIIALAPELNRKYEKLYAWLQDDVTRKKPTLDLIFTLLDLNPSEQVEARAAFAPQAPLLKYRLLHLADGAADGLPLLYRPIKLDDAISNFLLGHAWLDSRLENLARMIPVSSRFERNLVPEESTLCESLVRFARQQAGHERPEGRNVMFHFYGPSGLGKRTLARTVACELGLPLLVADAAKLIAAPRRLEEAIELIARQALLHPAALCIENLDVFLVDEERHRSDLETVIETAAVFGPVTFLISHRAARAAIQPGRGVWLAVPFSMPDDTMRRRLWEQALPPKEQLEPDVDGAALAGRFRFTGGQIRNAVKTALTHAQWRSDNSTRLSLADLCNACRAQSEERMANAARKIVPRYTWRDIVLSEDALAQLREICQRVIHRQRVMGEWGFDRKLSFGKGVNALFAGPSGTGKTMAAEIVAGELGLDLYRIDLSGVVSKYIGETEQNLDRVFRAAEGSNAILFFDEADALFGKRSEVRDSHDRYANIEISYLLQKMEEYEGVAILATNLRQNLDESFVRRLAFTIQFPFPEEADRRRIWDGAWPHEVPLARDIDWDLLSRQFKLSGGNIKNIALAAAFLAAQNGGVVTMAHLLQATRREFQKLGKPLTPLEMGRPEINFPA